MRLRMLFGKLQLRYTKTRCYVAFRGETNVSRYVVVAKDSSSVVVVHTDAVTGDETIQHVHFEGKYYWICLGAIREYFRKIV